MLKQSTCLISAVLLSAGIASNSYADNCSGHYTAVFTAYDSAEIDKGHSIAYGSNRNSVTSDNSAYNGVGVCSAIILTTPDGKMQMKYSCVRKTPDGDSWSLTGEYGSASDKGTWVQTGGTGKFAGKTGSGWWKPVMNDGKMEIGTWGGNCK